jgi:trehalose 6-phosphate phosphatase
MALAKSRRRATLRRVTDSARALRPELAPPPPALLEGASLFLDFDGTLVPLADTPDEVEVDDDLRDMLMRLRAGLSGRLAIVSGRSIETLRALGLGDFLLAGSHGLEFAQPGEAIDGPARLPAIDMVERAFEAFAAGKPGLLVERKSISVGLHFRGAPQWGEAVDDLASRLAAEHGLVVQRGKMLCELRPGGADKGSAVAILMRHPPMAGGIPVFVGDDVTDEEGFAVAAELGGAGILVGTSRPTFAAYQLEQVAAVRHYLAQGAARLG